MSQKIRPRFSYLTDLSMEEVTTKLKSHLEDNQKIRASFIQNKIFIKHMHEEQHYWSPELQISMYDEDDHRQINGLVGPQQTVWAMFLFMYGIVFLLGFFIGIYGLILWSLGDFTLWLISIPIAAVLLIFIYIAARFGQRKGHDQMMELVEFFKSSIGEIHLQKRSSE